jgi:hypothetical protein
MTRLVPLLVDRYNNDSHLFPFGTNAGMAFVASSRIVVFACTPKEGSPLSCCSGHVQLTSIHTTPRVGVGPSSARTSPSCCFLRKQCNCREDSQRHNYSSRIVVSYPCALDMTRSSHSDVGLCFRLFVREFARLQPKMKAPSFSSRTSFFDRGSLWHQQEVFCSVRE